MLKGKWKALLVLNYISAVVWMLLLLVFAVMVWKEMNGGPAVKFDAFTVGVGVVFQMGINFLFIYVLKAYYPSRKLAGVFKVIYVTALSIIGLLTIGILLMLTVSVILFLSKARSISDSNDFTIIIFFLSLLIVYVLIFSWQTQLINFLERNSERELKSVLSSIGTDENKNVE